MRSRTETPTADHERPGTTDGRRRRRRQTASRAAATLAGAALLGTIAVAPATARATGGEVGGEGREYFLSNSITTVGEMEFAYGRPSDRLYVGDWDGDGSDSLAVRRGRQYFLRNSLAAGDADQVIAFGNDNDTTYVGDWDGDGRDSFAVRRGSVFYIRNAAGSGGHDAVVSYGRDGDDVLVGDWDRNGRDDMAVRRGNSYFFRTTPGDGPADRVATYGRVGDEVLVGDWNADGFDTLGVRRGNTYFLRNAISTGIADVTVDYGRDDDVTLVGDWDGNGTDTLGVRRPPPPPPPPPQPTQYPIASYGTLRTGQAAHHVVHADAVRERTLRLPGFDLWLTPRTEFDWPWAVPNSGNTRGIVAEAFWFAPGDYSRMIAKVDRWEGYDPSLPLSRMNYTRQLRGTDVAGQNAWVYVATPWRVAYAHDIGWIVRSGDYVNRY